MLPNQTVKRIYAIFFLLVFLFQIGGYYVIFFGLTQQANKELLVRLHAESYTAEELIVLAIPFSLPYPVPEGEYEKTSGDFVHQGQFYKLVKQKLENDTLFVVCIKDKKATEIASFFSEFSKEANDCPLSTKKVLNYLGKIFKDYRSTEFEIVYEGRFLYEQILLAEGEFNYKSVSGFQESPPPEQGI